MVESLIISLKLEMINQIIRNMRRRNEKILYIIVDIYISSLFDHN